MHPLAKETCFASVEPVQPDENSRRWSGLLTHSGLSPPQVRPTPFRCSDPHSPSKVEGVAGTIAMGRRLMTFGSDESLIGNVLR